MAAAVIRGIDGILEITDPGGPTTEEIPCLTSWTLESTADTNTESNVCMLSNGDGGSSVAAGWDTTYVSGKGFSISSEHNWQEDQTEGSTGILDVTDVGKEITFNLYPNTNTTGKVEYSGTAVVTNVSVPSEANGKITQSVSYEGTGELVKTLVA